MRRHLVLVAEPPRRHGSGRRPELTGNGCPDHLIAESGLRSLFAPLLASRGLLLAVSGGPDSTALLLLVDRWRKTTHVPIAVATVDHRLRESSAQDALAVAALCAARAIPHHTLVWDGEPARTRIQERARAARYDLLARCAHAIGADTVVTGHHADDQAETILMRLTRGSGPAGLGGIAALSRLGPLSLARPLLGLPKATLVGVCRAADVAFVNDPSNSDEAFRRTALRRLAPTLARDGLDTAALCKLGERAARTEAALRWASDQARPMLAVERSLAHTAIAAASLVALPEELAIRIIGAELAAVSTGVRLRLSRLEPLVLDLRTAINGGTPFARTLGGCVVRHKAPLVLIERAPSRRCAGPP